MESDELSTLIGEIAREPGPPSTVDVDRAVRDGRRIRRTRRALRAGAAALAVAVAAGVASLLGGPDEPPPVVTAPGRFDPLVRYAGFGWLPAKLTQRTSQTAAGRLTLEAGDTDTRLSVRLYPAGRAVGDPAPDPPRTSAGCAPGERTYRAPSVHGRAAWWVSSRDVPGGGCRPTVVRLTWEYAPGAWAVADAGDLRGVAGGDRRNVLRRIAQTLRLGIDEPVRFPFRAGYLPRGLAPAGTYETRVSSDPGRWRVALILTPAGRAAARPGAVVTVRPAPSRPDHEPNLTVAGRPAFGTAFTDPSGVTTHLVNVFDVQGFEVDVQTSGGPGDAPARIARGLRPLGPDRAAWTTRPAG